MNELIGKLVTLIMNVPEKYLGTLCDVAEKLASRRGAEWWEELKEFAQGKPCWPEKQYLYFLRKLVVPETEAQEKANFFGIAHVDADSDYKAQMMATPAGSARSYKLIGNGRFDQIFGSLGEGRKKWQNLNQVIAFCSGNRELLKDVGKWPDSNHHQWTESFFELEGGFVARVSIHSDTKFMIYVRSLSYDHVWNTAQGKNWYQVFLLL